MELFYNVLGVECFQGPHESIIQVLHFATVVGWKTNDVNTIISSQSNDLQVPCV